MTTTEQLETIDNSLKAIKTAVISKGQTPSGDITTYATAINAIPVLDVIPYNAWDEYVMYDYSKESDSSKYYEIMVTDAFPSTNWSTGDFRNVRYISQAGSWFLGRNGQSYANIRFDNLKQVGYNTASSAGTYFMAYKSGLTLTFPELINYRTGNYGFSYSTNCNYTFSKLQTITCNYFLSNCSGCTFSFPELTTINSSYNFYNCTNCTFSFPKLTTANDAFLSNYNGVLTVNLPKMTKVYQCYYPTNVTTNKMTWNLTNSGPINIGTIPNNTNASKGSLEINVANATSLFFQLASATATSGDTGYSTVTITGPTNNYNMNADGGNYFCRYLGPGNLTFIQPILNKLKNITNNYSFGNCSLTELTLPQVTEITSRYILYSSTSTTKLNLPKCNSITNNNAFSSSSLTEIHFASSNKTAIEASSGYSSKWGRSAMTIYFDL